MFVTTILLQHLCHQYRIIFPPGAIFLPLDCLYHRNSTPQNRSMMFPDKSQRKIFHKKLSIKKHYKYYLTFHGNIFFFLFLSIKPKKTTLTHETVSLIWYNRNCIQSVREEEKDGPSYIVPGQNNKISDKGNIFNLYTLAVYLS